MDKEYSVEINNFGSWFSLYVKAYDMVEAHKKTVSLLDKSQRWFDQAKSEIVTDLMRWQIGDQGIPECEQYLYDCCIEGIEDFEPNRLKANYEQFEIIDSGIL